jgi:hypothetical protein
MMKRPEGGYGVKSLGRSTAGTRVPLHSQIFFSETEFWRRPIPSTDNRNGAASKFTLDVKKSPINSGVLPTLLNVKTNAAHTAAKVSVCIEDISRMLVEAFSGTLCTLTRWHKSAFGYSTSQMHRRDAERFDGTPSRTGETPGRQESRQGVSSATYLQHGRCI